MNVGPNSAVLRGTAQNPDVFFQAREASNPFYSATPGIVRFETNRTLTGMLAAETANSITLRRAENATDTTTGSRNSQARLLWTFMPGRSAAGWRRPSRRRTGIVVGRRADTLDRTRLLFRLAPVGGPLTAVGMGLTLLPLVVLDRPIPGISSLVCSDQDQGAQILCDTLDRAGVKQVGVTIERNGKQ